MIGIILLVQVGGTICLTENFLKSYVTPFDLNITIGDPQVIAAPGVLALQCVISLPQLPLSTISVAFCQLLLLSLSTSDSSLTLSSGILYTMRLNPTYLFRVGPMVIPQYGSTS